MTVRNYDSWISGRFEYEILSGVKLVADPKKGARVCLEGGSEIFLDGYEFHTYKEMIDFVYINFSFFEESGRYYFHRIC